MMIIKLNDYGQAIWLHNDIPNIVLDRPYDWCDRAFIIDENQGRLVIDERKFSEMHLDNWTPLDYNAYRERYYKCTACTPEKTCDDCKWPGC